MTRGRERKPIDLGDALDRAVTAAAECGVVGAETVTRPAAAGRVLAEPVALDRDSPPCDVSAMDGYAVRHAEIVAGPVRRGGTSLIGEPPATLGPGEAIAIYTGCPVPEGADTVVRFERAMEQDGEVALDASVDLTPGADIRRGGENGRAGDELLPAGRVVTSAAMSALASVGARELVVRRPLRVAVLTTGNELLDADDPAEPPPWRIRNSNGPALGASLSGPAWIGSVDVRAVADTLEGTRDTIGVAAKEGDVVVVTGGVSKGGFDFVPDAIDALGGATRFHGIKARPGQPTLVATVGRTPVVGLPGNPLSVLTVGRRLLGPLLRTRAGFTDAAGPVASVTLEAEFPNEGPLTLWKPVRVTGPGVATVASLRGSGDVRGPAGTDGFVEVPPGATGRGPFLFFSWKI